jgi:hypothetical protein
MLDEYVAPTPFVAEHVRTQLFSFGELIDIRDAIDRRLKGQPGTGSLYDTWLRHTGLDLTAPTLSTASLERALFDLTLGRRVKSLQLRYYSEINEARTCIQNFFDVHRNDISEKPNKKDLWWDGIHPQEEGHDRWVSRALSKEEAFTAVFERWRKDGEHLQDLLSVFEEESLLVNNPEGEHPVFSQSIAMHVNEWYKVWCLERTHVRLNV